VSRKKPNPFKHRVEYVFLRGIEIFIGILPETAALAFGVFCANALYFLGFRRKETARRIRQVFPEIPGRDIRRIARLSLRNMALNAVELMRLRRVTRPWIATHVLDLDAAREKISALHKQHGGLILALPHMGNWDLGGIVCERLGFNILAVAARQKNPYVNAWIAARRGQGIRMIERGASGDTARNALQLLREGWFFAILADVRVKKPDIEVDFLGGRANVGRGLATYAWVSGAPIVPVICERVGWRQHKFHICDPLPPPDTPDKDAAVQQQTQRILSLFESRIRQKPEQWLWYNKRWVLTPLQTRRSVTPQTSPRAKNTASAR